MISSRKVSVAPHRPTGLVPLLDGEGVIVEGRDCVLACTEERHRSASRGHAPKIDNAGELWSFGLSNFGIGDGDIR